MAFSFQLITWNFVPSTTSYRFQPSYSQHCKVHWPGYPTWNSSGCRLLRLHDSKIPTPSTFWENICTPRKTNMEPPKKKLECFGSFFFSFPKKMVDFSGFLAISFAGRIYIYIPTHHWGWWPSLGSTPSKELLEYVTPYLEANGGRWVTKPVDCTALIMGGMNQEIQIDLVKHVFMVKMLGESVRHGL